MNSKKRILFIINPKSGSIGKKRNIESIIEEKVDQNKFEYTIKYTQYQGHAIEIATNQAKNGFDIIVAVGGDGSINEVSKGIMNTDVNLGIIPSGSGNGLARYLNIPLNASDALDVILNGNVKAIDTVKLNDYTYLSIAGIGFDAHVAKKFEGSMLRGFLKYFSIASNSYMTYQQQEYHLILDDAEEIFIKAFFIAFANSNQFGYNTKIAPQADISDGMIDICIVRKPSLLDLPQMAHLLFKGEFDQSDNVIIRKAKKVEVIYNGDPLINLDGEPIEVNKNININVIPSSLKVIVPK
ncbi:MAG: diacylglycerol kinase family protein [Hyphomicrobiales bacterium]